ncbi:hypothetical protein FRZ44_05780 [Hypericibacter terrae]|uniref:Fe2OG dioxygenase domain-containing protein n=1 Tax=Hypericibacter terrae TaxID=2602015 RepID=A0A5J6MFR8_9PROT|nr:2OG-Fe(II) oxygenase [Hypericibacter terrae]QEX15295.1 hypothetical protein FRZ44_05780 [Hypericibacter terrae]
MRDLLDLERYPIDRLDSSAAKALIARCQADLDEQGMFDLEDFVRREVIEACAEEMRPRMDRESFTHTRSHNVYFQKDVPGVSPDHPALRQVNTTHHTLCGDQLGNSTLRRIYEWKPLADFLSRALKLPALHVMDDPLARINVIGYRAGETLNWHFDRSQFTTTLLIQAPEAGGEFQYRSDLRSETDRNLDGVARVLRGEDPAVRTRGVKPGTLNVFKGKNTLHRITPPVGERARLIAIFSYYERPGVSFSAEERRGFYGRTG